MTLFRRARTASPLRPKALGAGVIGAGRFVLDGRLIILDGSAQRLLQLPGSAAISGLYKKLSASDGAAIEHALLSSSALDLQFELEGNGILMRGRATGPQRIEGVLLKLPVQPRHIEHTPVRARDEFVAAISHELRTPLNAILGFLRLARADAPEGMERRHLDHIDQASRLMLRVVNDLLDLTRLEAGKLEIDPDQPLSLHAVVSRVGAVAASLRQDKPVRLYASVAENCPVRLRGDVGRLEQILLNLVANALKFTDKGRVVIDVKLRAQHDHSVVLRMSVSDTGAGIPLDQMSRVGQPFEQASNLSMPQTGGTGLGLAVVKRLLELHGASLKVASVAGGGSIFWFDIELPFESAGVSPDQKAHTWVISEDDRLIQSVATQWAVHGEVLCDEGHGHQASRWILDVASERAQHMAGQGVATGRQILWVSAEPSKEPNVLSLPLLVQAVFQDAEEEALTLDPHLQGLRVLVVEDNALNQHVLREYLRRLGVDVTIVGEGKPVPVLLGQRHVDLILLDIQLPDWSGWDVAKAVRALPNGQDMRIVFLSAHVDQSDQVEAAGLGALACLSKPFDAPTLHQILRDVALVARVAERKFEHAPVQATSKAQLGAPRPKAALLSLFASQWPGLKEQVLQAQDAHSLRQAVHALRGSLAVLGQASMVEQARQLEEALLAGRSVASDALQSWLDEIESLFTS